MKATRFFIAAAAVCVFSAYSFTLGAANTSAYTETSAKISVNCLNVTDSASQTYDIKIEPEAAHTPMPVSDILHVGEDDSAYFEIPLTEPGTFTYRIYELAGNSTDILYDSSVYRVSLYVENGESDTLTCSVIVLGNDQTGKQGKIDFQQVVLGDSDEQSTGAASETEATTASESTETETTTTTTDAPKTTVRTVTSMIGSVLTGDSFPALAVRTALIAAVVGAACALLFKRRNGKEDQNEV